MTEKPILFSGEMVRAILDGRKTQTRRVIKPQPIGVGPLPSMPVWKVDGVLRFGLKRCPYGQPGSLLWVRETWAHLPKWTKPAYRADWKTPDAAIKTMGTKWRPSIFMPRWASRLKLLVLDVRVERVQEIEPSDCVAEGIYNAGSLAANTMYREAFATLWDSINARRGYPWDSNPWVWVVEFKMI